MKTIAKCYCVLLLISGLSIISPASAETNINEAKQQALLKVLNSYQDFTIALSREYLETVILLNIEAPAETKKLYAFREDRKLKYDALIQEQDSFLELIEENDPPSIQTFAFNHFMMFRSHSNIDLQELDEKYLVTAPHDISFDERPLYAYTSLFSTIQEATKLFPFGYSDLGPSYIYLASIYSDIIDFTIMSTKAEAVISRALITQKTPTVADMDLHNTPSHNLALSYLALSNIAEKTASSPDKGGVWYHDFPKRKLNSKRRAIIMATAHLLHLNANLISSELTPTPDRSVPSINETLTQYGLSIETMSQYSEKRFSAIEAFMDILEKY